MTTLILTTIGLVVAALAVIGSFAIWFGSVSDKMPRRSFR